MASTTSSAASITVWNFFVPNPRTAQMPWNSSMPDDKHKNSVKNTKGYWTSMIYLHTLLRRMNRSDGWLPESGRLCTSSSVKGLM